MTVRKVQVGLTELVSTGRLVNFVRSVLNEGHHVLADYSTDRDLAAGPGPQCVRVGAVGPKVPILSRLMQKLGVKYSSYWTCRIVEADELSPVASEALLARELRLRVFHAAPSPDTVRNWEPSEFWNVGSGLPEEIAADLVIAFVNDLSAIVLLGNDGAVSRALKQLADQHIPAG